MCSELIIRITYFLNHFRSRKEDDKAAKKRKQPNKKSKPKTLKTSEKLTAKDIMGSDSEIDDSPSGKRDELNSYLSRRVANGISKQYNNDINGSCFIDLKLYTCEEIVNISPMNRWRHAIVTLKMKSEENDPAYRYLVKFLKEAKNKFKDCPVTYVSSPNQ